jgi:anti-sigma regulatory factor (Ser/Thr protein kinase)
MAFDAGGEGTPIFDYFQMEEVVQRNVDVTREDMQGAGVGTRLRESFRRLVRAFLLDD